MFDKRPDQGNSGDIEKQQPPKRKQEQGIIYLRAEWNDNRDAKQQDKKQRQGLLAVLASIGGIVAAIIAIIDFVYRGEAGGIFGTFGQTLTKFFAGIGMSISHLTEITTLLGPWGAAAAALFLILILKLLAERLGFFVTVTRATWRDVDGGFRFMILEYVLSCLLFLPLAALWVGAFYFTVPRWGVAAFAIGYFATTLLATLLATNAANPFVQEQMYERFAWRLILGQRISVLVAIATAIAFIAQGLVLASFPTHDPWVAAGTALFAAMASRFLAEQIGFFVTPKATFSRVFYGSLVLSPIAALWIGAFYSAVSLWGLAAFVVAYVVTITAATELSIPIRMWRRS
jgi:hypothetical protein